MHAIAAPARVASRGHHLHPPRHADTVAGPSSSPTPRSTRATTTPMGRRGGGRGGQAIGVLAVPLGIHALITPDAAHAAGGWYNDVQLGPRSDGGFIGGGASGGAGDATPAFGYEDRGDDYDYGEFILIRV